DISPAGTLLYVRGTGATGRVISWMDSSGNLSPLLAKPGEYFYPRLSPDGKRLAVMLQDGSNQNLWVYDSTLGTMTRITSGTEKQYYPVWSPDGEFVVFKSGNRLAW